MLVLSVEQLNTGIVQLSVYLVLLLYNFTLSCIIFFCMHPFQSNIIDTQTVYSYIEFYDAFIHYNI
jgi:energy-converting hydrogenase Eha subunit E